MTTFFTVKCALVPFAIFIALAAYGWPALGIAAGFTVSIIVAAWRIHSGEIKNLELAAVAIFGALLVGLLVFPKLVSNLAIPLAFGGLAVYAIGTVILGRPWTAEFSRITNLKIASTRAFMRINMILSAMWAAIFGLIAIIEVSNGGYLVKVIVVAGAVASIYGPKLLSRISLIQRG